MNTIQKKPYYRMKNRESVNIRLNAEERSFLEIQMRNDGWEKAATYIKYKLGFLQDRTTIARGIIQTKKSDDMVILLKNELKNLAEQFGYYRGCFNSVSAWVSNNAGTDAKKMIAASKKQQKRILSLLCEMINMISYMAKELGLDSHPGSSVESTDIDIDNLTIRDLNLAAEQLNGIIPPIDKEIS